jgi:hypothetical protein
MAKSTISINPAEPFTLDLAFKNTDGSAYNLTGCSVELEIRKSASSSPIIDKPVTSHTNAAQGLTAIALTSTDTNIAVRAWQFTITLTDSHGVIQESATNYLLVTNSSATTGPVTVYLGNNMASVTLTLAGPSGMSGVGVPVGGTSGQVLAKNSATNYDTGWTNQTGGSSGNDKTYSLSFIGQSFVTVPHSLGKYPAVSVLDSAGDVCEGDIDHLSINTLTLSFSAAFSGVVVCN